VKALFSFEGVSYSYYDMVPALRDVSFSVRDGEMLAVIGANGSGKSTLLQIMSALIHPQAGRVFFRGGELTEKRLAERDFQRRFRQQVGIVFQNSEAQLFCPTVFDELVFGPMQLGLAREELNRRALQVMDLLNIEGLRDRPTHMLSGGEKKRVAIGSILTMNPDVLLLDEPASGLDPKTETFLIGLIRTLADSGKTIVLATHDLELVDHLRPRVVVLSEDHRIEQTGTIEEILKNEDLLVRVNLIHEHAHRHGGRVHSHLHSHYFFHSAHHEHADAHGQEKKHARKPARGGKRPRSSSDSEQHD